jgi:hypothetical protein
MACNELVGTALLMVIKSSGVDDLQRCGTLTVMMPPPTHKADGVGDCHDGANATVYEET